MFRYPKTLRWRTIFLGALAVGISNSMAVAQETEIQSSQQVPDQVTSAPEMVIVTTVRRAPWRSTIGAPIENVSMSANVQTDDLNPLSPADMLTLRYRVRDTARRLCDQLEFRYPISVPDKFQCSKIAARHTLDRIDAGILNSAGAPEIQNP